MMVHRDARPSWRRLTDPSSSHMKAIEPFLPLDRDRLALALGASLIGYAVLPQIAPAFVALAAAAVAIRLGHDRKAVKEERPGIMLLGHDRETGRAYRLDRDAVRKHAIVLGQTGAGKTEALLGWAENSLNWQSGFTIVDGKGDVAIAAKVMAMARAHGRAHDVVVLNTMPTGSERSTNEMNPFAPMGGSAPAISLGHILEPFPGNAAHQADLFAHFLSVMATTLENADPARVAEMADEATTLNEVVAIFERADHPAASAASSYLRSLPGFEADRGSRQTATVGDLHSSIRDWAIKGLQQLRDAWAPLLRSNRPDVDMLDVILNRRILVVALPPLERGMPPGVRNVDQILVARTIVQTIRAAMIKMLPTIRGTWNELVDRCPPTVASPYLVVLDEVSHYATKSIGLLLAQARSLNLGFILADEDVQRLKRIDSDAAKAMLDATATKIFMRIERLDGKAARGGPRSFESLEQLANGMVLGETRPMKAGEAIVMHEEDIVHLIAPYPHHDPRPWIGKGVNEFVKLDPRSLA